MSFQVGQKVRYESFAGAVYPAEITGAGPPGFFDLDVDVGTREPWPLKAVRAERVHDDDRA